MCWLLDSSCPAQQQGKYPALRAAWNNSLSRPCRATLSPQGGEGTVSGGASPGKLLM
ncbi:MAG: hypothetical protein LBB55_05435 [Zoogloeaceae bacterium]|nr:hypothetical protein [Zoogloeaceae bacterium]